MEFSAKYLRWAPFAKENPESPGKLPKYGEAFTLGELNKVVITPTFNEAKAYGSDVLARNVIKYKESTVAVTILDISRENMSAISGATIEEGTHKNLRFRTTDNPPYGGLGFIAGTMLEQNKAAYYGIFTPKLKATLQGKEYNTNGENITLANEELSFTASSVLSDDYKIESPFFDSEQEAMDWVDGMFTGESTDIGKDEAGGTPEAQSAPARTSGKASQV